MLKDDIIIAQKIVSNSYSNINFEKPYHEHSFIYKTTNEYAVAYQKLLNLKKSIIGVTASGDQVLNSVLAGIYDIDCYDISVFPKYFLELKIAAIKALNEEEFIKYFFKSEYYSEFDNDIYDKVRKFLSPWAMKFWDSLYNFFDGYEIYNSTLFSSEPYNLQHQKERNPYLNNYDELKNRIEIVNINYHEGNVYNILNKLEKKYDFINLSSIIYYEPNLLKNYKEFVINNKNINDEGIILTYLYKLKKDVLLALREYFYEPGFNIETYQNDGLLIYQKKI